MRFLRFIFIICVIHSECYAQNNIDDKKAIAILKEFYVAHSSIWSIIKSVSPNVFDQKLDSLQKKYCTMELRNKAKKYIGDGFDVLTDDRGIDSIALKTMTIVKDTMRKNTYTISYDMSYNNGSNITVKRHVALHVGVIKEGENYKIASVK